jgi:hypothetical protein
LDELIDRDDIDLDKYLEWMKTQDADATIESVLIVEKEEDETDDDQDKKDDDDLEVKKAAALKKEGDQTEGDDKKEDKKVEEESKGKTDDDSVVDGKTKTKTIKISDEYITKQVQNFREQMKDKDPELINKKSGQFQDILNGIKGGEMDAKALKNYINAQMYIKTIKSPFDKDWKPESKVVEDPEYIRKATEQKQKMIQSRIKEKFPTIPDDAFEDEDALKEFEESLSRREFQDYTNVYDTITKEIDSEYDRYVHIVNNWEDIAKDTITTDVKLFEARLAKVNLSLKDLGIDSLDLDEKDLYNEYLWKNVLFTEGDTNQPDDSILVFMDDTIPVVRPGTIYNKLLDLNLEAILGQKQHDARKQGFNAGLNNHEDPSTSDLAGKEHREKIEIDEEDFDDDNLTPEQIQDKLDKLKAGMLQASGAKVKKR